MNQQLKNDFPIDWESDHHVTRREFFKFLTLASAGVAVGTVGMAAFAQLPRQSRQFEPLLVADLSSLEPGSFKAFAYPRPTDLCILVRKLDGELVAYSRRCTHLSCPVQYEVHETSERLYCPCHNGAFSVHDGSVLQGPPPRPIPRIELDVRDNQVWAVGVAMRGHHDA